MIYYQRFVKKFYNYTKQITLNGAVLNKLAINVDQKVDFGFKLRINEANTQDNKHPTIDATLQRNISSLWELHKETQPLWRMTGQSLLNKNKNG